MGRGSGKCGGRYEGKDVVRGEMERGGPMEEERWGSQKR